MEFYHHIKSRLQWLFWVPLGPVLVCCGESQQGANERPNIVFILADDLGYHDLGCTGSTFYETPNVDRIAAEGIVFTNGYAACQVCSPSRASIMTGKSPLNHGITDYIGAPQGADWRQLGRHTRLLPASYDSVLQQVFVTLPEALQDAGYKTFFAGKWHLGGLGSWPEDHGFAVNKGGWDKGSPVGGYFSPWDNPNLENTMPGENLTMRLATETAEFMKENNPRKTGQPFFAFLSFYAVHGPIQTTQRKWAKYREKAIENGVAKEGFKMGRLLPIRQVQDNPVYAGLVETMDDAVGLVLKAIDQLGLSANTIIIFTSDNGGVSAGDSFSTANLPLRGGKGYQFEGGIRVPYFLKVPGMAVGHNVFNEPVIGMDFYPTLLDLVGLPLKPEEHSDGMSLLPLLKGDTISERTLYWHYPHYGNQGGEPTSIIRQGYWKLIYYHEDERMELYNLERDPGEQFDLSRLQPDKANALRGTLNNYLLDRKAAFPTHDILYNAKAEQAYLQGMKKNMLPKLERQRLNYLSKGYNPGNNWWGSQGGQSSSSD